MVRLFVCFFGCLFVSLVGRFYLAVCLFLLLFGCLADCLFVFLDADINIILGVVNGKCETLRDGETSAFLCEPERY